MNQKNTRKFPKMDFESALTLLVSRLAGASKVEEPYFAEYVNYLIDDIYRQDQDYNLKDTPIDVTADWLRRARNTGKMLWVKTAEQLRDEFEKLYKKTGRSDYAIASEMLYPAAEVYKKLHSRLNKTTAI